MAPLRGANPRVIESRTNIVGGRIYVPLVKSGRYRICAGIGQGAINGVIEFGAGIGQGAMNGAPTGSESARY